MLKKLFVVFKKDLVTTRRDFMAMFILVMPVVLAAGVMLFTPGLNDTTINLAMLKSDDADHIEYMEQFAKVELFGNMEEIERRVLKRDDIAAIVPATGGESEYEVVLQGNESEVIENYAVMLNTFYDLGATREDSTSQLVSFGKAVSPIKAKLVNMLISMTIMMAGMLISISIVEEKFENTVNALNVTTISQTGFVLGKSLLGSLMVLIGIVCALLITGFYDVNWVMILLVGFSAMLLSFIIGFLQGLGSDDVIEAAAGVKMVMLPIAGSIVGYEFLADTWQWTMFWSPFYWAYKANDLILSKTADWGTVLLCAAMVLVLTFLIYLLSLPKLRKGLS